MKSVNSQSTQSNESSRPAPGAWIWRVFPTFWTALLVIGLALDTLGIGARRPDLLYGWRAVGLGVLLIGLVGGYQWFSWRRLYHDAATSMRRALVALGVQLLALLLLVVGYDPSFAWFSLALLYQIIGGLPRRHWPLPLACVLLLFVVAAVVANGSGTLDAESAAGGVVLLVVSIGVALFIRLLHDQRDQLRRTLEQLRAAHAALAANAAQAEELAMLHERTRLAREMHDNIGYALVAMNVKLEAAQLLYARDPARGDAELEATRALIRSTMTNLRRTLADLRAPIAEHGDLPAALQQLAHETQARSGIELTCRITPNPPALPQTAREALWYVAREALANVEQHAAASSITLYLEAEHDGVRLQVVDDGSGITPADLSRPKHYGVIGMRERLEAAGGTLHIERGASGGTLVEAYMPIYRLA
jgi:signal transduction histidine kinase